MPAKLHPGLEVRGDGDAADAKSATALSGKTVNHVFHNQHEPERHQHQHKHRAIWTDRGLPWPGSRGNGLKMADGPSEAFGLVIQRHTAERGMKR